MLKIKNTNVKNFLLIVFSASVIILFASFFLVGEALAQTPCNPDCLSDYTCVGGTCKPGTCGDGKCNDCSNAFSPCDINEPATCSRDCGSSVGPVIPVISGLPLPTQAATHFYSAVANPVISSDPAQAKPVGLGAVANGGSTVSLKVDINLSTNASFDVYLAFTPPGDSKVYYFNGNDFVASDNLVKWKFGVNGRITQTIFQNINLANIAKGEYNVYLGVSPANIQSRYYLWHTKFTNNYSSASKTCTSYSQCGLRGAWSCIDGQCRTASCGDGFCNTCEFSPCEPTSETAANCPSDCGGTSPTPGTCVPVTSTDDAPTTPTRPIVQSCNSVYDCTNFPAKCGVERICTPAIDSSRRCSRSSDCRDSSYECVRGQCMPISGVIPCSTIQDCKVTGGRGSACIGGQCMPYCYSGYDASTDLCVDRCYPPNFGCAPGYICSSSHNACVKM